MRYFKFQISSLRLAAVVFGLMLLLSGCSKKPEPVQNTDTQSPDVSSVRIISMSPNLTEILFALGLDEEIVGVTKYSTYPPQAQTKKCIGSFWQPDIEAVLMLEPTLVVTLGFKQQTTLAARLEAIGCETLTVNIESIDDLYAAIDTIGKKVNRSAEAQQMLARLKAKQQQIIQKNRPFQKPKVLWVIQRDPLRVAGTKTYINELIETAGGVNAIGDTIQIYPPISTENVIRAMPDVIIEPSMNPEYFQQQKDTADAYYARFGIVPAVKHGRVYVIDGDLVSRLSPRLDEAMELVHQCIGEPQESN